jgi:lysozyme
MDIVKARIKAHEGYRLEPYKDTLGFLTGGWGHKILGGEEVPQSEAGWQELFDKDFDIALKGANSLIQEHLRDNHTFLSDSQKAIIQGVLIEMCFQLGQAGVGKFKNMFKALGECDFSEAALQMQDSRWYQQTPARCLELSDIIKNI